MKYGAILLLIGLFMVSPKMEAQVEDLLGAISEGAESLGEENSNNTNEAPSESDQRIQDELERRNEENSGLMSLMEGKYQRCLIPMLSYYEILKTLKDQRAFAGQRMSRCDSYDMQLSAIATSTTIMYCPEGIDGLSLEDKLAMVRSFWNVLDEEYNKVGPSEATVRTHERWTSLLRDLMTGLGQSSPYNSVPIEDIQLEDLPQELQEDLRELLEQLGLDAEDRPLAHPDVQLLMRLNYLVQFFKPQFIMKRSFEIVQERDEIGCD